uniref:Uncharacterized protein n=1 Tax=Zea mays TaxID=4577 RepID=A0A804N0P9_MAIZE
MGFRAASAAAAAAVAVFAAAGLAVTAASSGDSLADLGGAAREIESAPEVKNLGPWAKGLLKGMPQAAAGPAAMAPVAKYPLVLAEDRTRRPDVLRHLKVYEGGWNVTNKHYWASVSFTGVSGFLLGALWFIFFGIAVAGRCYFGTRMSKRKVSYADVVGPVLLGVFTLAIIYLFHTRAGCILLLYGQSKFHEEATRTVDFVVNQSDFTIQTLRNVTEYLSFAQTITVAALYLPSEVQGQIDSLKGDLNKAADTISVKTAENYKMIRKVLHIMSVVLICIAVVLLVLVFLGYGLEKYGPRYTVYIFVTLCWKAVAALFILLGIFLILNSIDRSFVPPWLNTLELCSVTEGTKSTNTTLQSSGNSAAQDTCEAMDQWAQHPQAETALSSILPCVDESTTNRTLYQSKEVVVRLVGIVNRAISALSNRRPHHKHPGQFMPYLCSPYDSNLNDRPCKYREATFENATTVSLATLQHG